MEKRQLARHAGLAYLLLVVCGIVNLLYIPSKLIVWEDAARTLENLQQHEQLFRLGIVTGIVAFLAFLALPLLLHKLLHGVNKAYATLMVVLALVSIPISFTNMLHNFSILTLLGEPAYLVGWTKLQFQQQVMLHLDYYNDGIQLVQIFWGLWLFPFGYLVYQSGFLPKLLGVLLMAGCMGYLIDFFAGFLIPEYKNSLIQTIVGIPTSVGEIGICLWLLVVGVKLKKRTEGNE
jgi:hypothetical protein